MPTTITLSLPPGAEVVLPASGSLPKSAGAPVTITVANEAGEPIQIDSAGAATKFTVGAVPPSIGDGESDVIPLTVLASGGVNFQHESDESLVFVTVAGAALTPFSDRQQQLRYVRP